MKFRADYVTNSSSSSFILCFDTKEAYNDFIEDNGKYFKRLTENYLKTSTKQKRKDDALDLLKRYYKYWVGYHHEIMAEKFKDVGKYGSVSDMLEKTNYKKSIEYNNKLEDLLNHDEEYLKQCRRINESEYLITLTLWDTDDNVLGWAARNGYLEQAFRDNLIIRWNIG